MKNLFYILTLIITLTSTSCSKNQVVISDGQLANDKLYLDGEIKPFSGIVVVPFKDNNTIKEVRKFNKGIVEGEAVSYFSNGTIKRKGEYKKGKMDGTWEQWFQDGQKAFQASYKNDSMTGCFKEWYSNGNVKEEGLYLNNSRVGKWKYYDPSGALSYEKDYNKIASPINQSNQNQCI